MRSTANQAANVAGNKITNMFNRHVWDHVLDIDEMLWWRSKEVDVNGNVVVPFKPGAILIGLIAITAMWLLNLVVDWAGTNGGWGFISYPAFFASFVIGFGGYFAIWRQIAKPRNIGFGAFLFATFNALQWKNPARGAVTGAGTVIGLAGVIGLYYLFTALVLWTWGFINSPMAFWIGVAAIIILASLGAVAGVRAFVMGLYTTVVLIMALWSTFGGVYHGKAFNPNTGEPLYMVDQRTGYIDDLNRSPEDCRPAGVLHKGFDYTKGTICFDEESSLPLVPITADQVLNRNAGGIVHKAAERVENLNLPSISLGGSGAATSVGCSDHVPLVEHGMRITVAAGCPVKVDQMNMKNGTDFKLVDPALRAVTGRQQLVTMDPDNNNRFVTFQANAEGLRRYGRTAVEVELYHAGTGDAEVARRHGVVKPNIDLNPAR